MENNENKTLGERKEEFKQAANQTVPVMGLEHEKVSVKSESSDVKLHCTGCVAHCADACVSSCKDGCGEDSCKDTCKDTCKDKCTNECENNCYNGNFIYKG